MECGICGAVGFKNTAGFSSHHASCERRNDFVNLVNNELFKGLLTCEFGCGKPAQFLLKSGKICCEKFFQSCSAIRKRNGDSKRGCKSPRGMLGKHNGRMGKTNIEFFGIEKAKEIGRKISNRIRGRVTGYASTIEKENERRNKISKIARLNKSGSYGGYKPGSGRGKHGWYKGIWCDSSWELAWVMFHLDHNIPFERNRDRFEYVWNGKKYKYSPDFKMADGCHVEVKAWLDDKGRAKLAACQGVIVLMKKEMEPYLQYASEKYGKNFIRMYDGGKVNKCGCGKELGCNNRSGRCFSCAMAKRTQRMKRMCSCGRIVSTGSDSGLCKRCVGIGRGRKVERPKMSVIMDNVKELGFSATGRLYGVSDNAVRKWLKGSVAELDKASAPKADGV